MEFTWHLGPLAVLLFLGSASSSLAQQLPSANQDDLQMNEPLQSRYDRRGLLERFYIGPFQVAAVTQADLGFNDNVFAQPSGQKSDFFVDLGGKLITTYRYDAFSAELDAYLLDHQYLSLTSEDYWEGNGRLSLREAPAPDFAYFLQSGIQRLAVPRTDPNPIDGRTPATYLLFDTLAGVTIGSGQRNLLTLSVGYDQTQFDSVEGLTGPIDTAERNRTEVFGDFRWDHVFFGQQKFFVELRPDTRNYAQDVDTAGFRQSSNGARLDTGMVFEPDGLFLITASTGYQQQDYADPRFGTIGEPDAVLDVQWSPTLLTQIDAKYVHEYAEDIDIDSPGYTRNEAIVTLSHELRRDILVTLLVSDDYRDLERSPRRFDVIDVGPRVQYRLADGVQLGFTYDHQQLNSNSTIRYGDDTALVTVKKTF